jgi:hypothetical protein
LVVANTVTLKIVSVPPTRARFAFDGRPLGLDSAGVASVLVPCNGNGHAVQLLSPRFGTDRRFTFVRWSGSVGQDQRNRPTLSNLVIRHDLTLQVGFDVSYVIKYVFLDPSGHTFKMSRVNAVTIKVVAGNRNQQRSRGGTVRLAGLNVRQSGTGLVATPVIQGVESVEIDNSNAVSAGQQTFSPAEVWRHKGAPLKIKVGVYTAHIAAYSRLRGIPVGSAVVLTYPDGRTVRLPMHGGPITVENLVRGDYVLKVVSPGAIAFAEPVRLSSNQYIDLPVITFGDVLLVLGVATMIASVLLWLRMRFVRRCRTTLLRRE